MSPAEPSVSKDHDIEFGEENNDHGYDGDDDGVYPMETDDGNYTHGREESSKYIVQEVADNGDDNETVASKDHNDPQPVLKNFFESVRQQGSAMATLTSTDRCLLQLD